MISCYDLVKGEGNVQIAQLPIGQFYLPKWVT